VSKIYMQELWATATIHHHSIQFKMNNKKHIVNLESFREIGAIRRLTDVNITKLHQPWRSFAAIINKCLTEKSSSYDSLRLSQAQILWGLYHKRNVDFAYLMWEDFVYQVEHKDTKKSNAMYYPREEESFDPILQTPKDSEDEGDGEEDLGLNIGEEERYDKEEAEDELYRDVNINQGMGLRASLEVEDSHVTLTMVHPDGMESIFETTSQMDVQTPTLVAPLPITTPTMTSSTIATTTTSQAPILPTTVPSDIIQNLPSFGSLFHFDDRLRSLEENFSEVMQTNQFVGAVFAIPRIVQHYMDQWINEAVKVSVQIQSDRLRDEDQRENDEFLRTVDENIKKIIKEQVKEQVKVQVSKILPRIEQTVNEQLEAEVLTRSSHSSRTSYAVAADLSEMELKKILIEKMEGNKSIQRSDEQRNLYKALVDAYESDKLILDTYEETVTLKRRRDDDADKDEEPFIGPDRRSKRCKEGKEPESASAPTENATRSADRSSQGSRSRQASHPEWFPPQQKPPTLDHDWNKTLLAIHGSIQPCISELPKQADSRSSFNELMDTPLDFSNFLMNRLGVNTLTPKLLVGPTYELMKGLCKSLIELKYHMEEVYKAKTDQLDRVNPEGASSRKYTTSITKTKAADYGHIKWIEDLVPRTMWIQETIGYDKHALWGVSHWGRKHQQFYNFAVNRESARDVYSKIRIIAVTELKIVEWHSYKHLDWITRRVEDLQLAIESYQKKLNLTKLDSYRSDLKRKEAYIAYSNP
nr:hypothetical protein [Tanacetum cinerariifolium]